MSVTVPLAELGEVIAGYGPAYLITVDDDGGPRVLAVTPRWEGGAVVVGGVGRSTSVNARSRPAVSVLWPPHGTSGDTLIVDGTAAFDDDEATLTVTPGAAVLHVRRS